MEFEPEKHSVADIHIYVSSDVPEDTDVLSHSAFIGCRGVFQG
jgi:hypothetical protein